MQKDTNNHKEENVWEYPRPPALEKVPYRLTVTFNGEIIADTTEGYRVLETSHPPCYYFPPTDVKKEFLVPSSRGSFCEWKGQCSYWTIKVGDKEAKDAAWYYPSPSKSFSAIKDYISFYANRMDECTVDGEKVIPQKSDFYGGWVTSWISGGQKGMKGPPGTEGW